MKYKSSVIGIGVLSLCLSTLAFGQNNSPEPQNIGQGAKMAAGDIKNGTARGADKLGSETAKGAGKFSDKARSAGSDLKQGKVVAAGKNLGEGTGSLAIQTTKGLGGLFQGMGSGVGHGTKSLGRGVKKVFDPNA